MQAQDEVAVEQRAAEVERVVRGFRIVNRAIDRGMLPLLVELGLTMPQFKAMIAVVTSSPDGISVTELGHELSVGQPSASLIIDQLERLGYVKRESDATDRRRVLAKATELGFEITGELRCGRAANFREWLSRVPDADLGALAEGLDALSEVVQASPLGRPLR